MADLEKINLNGTDLNICDKTARDSIPTKTSELTNDSNFVSAAYDSQTKTLALA